MDFMVQVLSVIVAVLSLAATVIMFILGNIRRDNKAERDDMREELKNLYRIKGGISGELSAFKQEAAKEFVTYPRMALMLESHANSLNTSIARIEAELKVLPQVREMLAALSARINNGPVGGLSQINGRGD